mmetsp:Transcript_46916/g.144668  ORF Transcript_46916/g.144668 Transcript_46916/m.144668 type:complete len:201 (-) Transcript_46916:174-776(-)
MERAWIPPWLTSRISSPHFSPLSTVHSAAKRRASSSGELSVGISAADKVSSCSSSSTAGSDSISYRGMAYDTRQNVSGSYSSSATRPKLRGGSRPLAMASVSSGSSSTPAASSGASALPMCPRVSSSIIASLRLCPASRTARITSTCGAASRAERPRTSAGETLSSGAALGSNSASAASSSSESTATPRPTGSVNMVRVS